MTKHILLDCDGVLCDFVQSTIDFYKEHSGVTKTEHDITEFDIFKSFGDKTLWKEYREWANKESFCRNLPAYSNTKKIIDGLHELGEVHIVTSPFDTDFWHKERIEWLEQFGIHKNRIVFMKDKEFHDGDILIDDYHHNTNVWSEKWGRNAVLINRPWNKQFESGPKVVRTDIDNVLETVKYILR